MRGVLLVLVSLLAVGCGESAPQLIPNPRPFAVESPAANLPVELRPYNWTDALGSGSCVNASTVYQLRWRGKEELADWWRKNHAGGETGSSIRSHHDRANVRYAFTQSADPNFLDWCSRTRRGAIIWYYPRHCVTFVGFTRENGRELAWINDNNRPQRYISIERNQFIQNWREYGGFALSILDPPAPPPLWPAYRQAI